MRVSRKLFFAIAALVAALGFIFVFIMQFGLRDSLYSMMEAAKSNEVQTINGQLTGFYESNGRSWEGVQQFMAEQIELEPDAGLVLRARNLSVLGHAGTVGAEVVVEDGLRNVIGNGRDHVAAIMFLYDDEIAAMSMWRKSSYYMTLFMMTFGVVVLVALFLVPAYWLSRRLTAPLQMFLPAIEQLKRGEQNVRVPILSSDEYGKVAEAFNDMSQQLLRNEQVRRSLVADVAHELRTPLTIMQGKLELYQQNNEPIEPTALLPIQDELLRLTSLVEDLHQISLAEAKKLPLNNKTVEMNDWLQKVVDNVREGAALRHIELILELAAEPLVAVFDPHRMTQVLMNIISNALRHTPEKGTITVQLSLFGQEKRQPHAVLSVTDTGQGIAPDHLPHIFDRFYRADEDRSRGSGGTGLGLAISKQLMEAQGGSISVESTVGKGTTFTLRIPLN